MNPFALFSFRRWSAIAAKLPGRTDNEIKNHWHTHLKKRLHQIQSTANPGKIDGQSTNGVQSASKKRREIAPKEVAEDPDLSQPPILESSSSSEISNLSYDCAPLPYGTNSVMEDISSQSPLEPIVESSDDFWTQPFLADTVYFSQNDDLSSVPLVEGEFLPPYDHFLYYDDGFDYSFPPYWQ